MKESSKYVIANLVCKYLVFADFLTPEEKADIVGRFNPKSSDKLISLDYDALISAVRSVSDYPKRDIPLIQEAFFNLRGTADALCIETCNYKPAFSLNLDLYLSSIENYLKVKPGSNLLYVNKDATPVTPEHVWYFYRKMSKELGIKVTASSLRKQATREVAKKKGLVFANNLLGHKRIESTLYLLED